MKYIIRELQTLYERVSGVWKPIIPEEEQKKIFNEIKDFIYKINKYALVKININDSPLRWLSEQLLREQDNELWKHLSSDRSSSKHFLSNEPRDPTEGTFFLDIDFLIRKAGNRTGGLDKEISIRKAFETGKKLPTPQYWLTDNNLGEGNHRVMVAKEFGLKSVPVRVYWK